jgi:hypothetical protein
MTDKQINELYNTAKKIPPDLEDWYLRMMKDAVNNINTERGVQRLGGSDVLQTAYNLMKEIIDKYDGWGLGDDDPNDQEQDEEEQEEDEEA